MASPATGAAEMEVYFLSRAVVAIGFSALHVALQYTTAINGALFQGLMSIFLITALIILGDRFGVREGIGVLGFTGVTVIVTHGNVNVLFGLTFNIGDIILLSDDVVFGVPVFLRRAPAS